MKNSVLKLTVFSFVVAFFALTFSQCDDKDKYYERPTWLEPPIFTVLEKKGNFTKYLQCVERTEYAKVLKGAGLYTVFAPNDEAFDVFLKENGYSSVKEIPDETVRQLVAYSMVYSTWKMEHLGDMLVSQLYIPGAFKRKTNLYALPYRDPEYDNKWVFDEPYHGGYSYMERNYQYLLTSQNYKYLPVFTDAFFNSFMPQPLTKTDYTTFFPNSEYTGKNVQAGTILTPDIPAENGVIHEVSTVNLPLSNIAIILKQPEFEKFKSLLDLKTSDNAYVFKSYLDVAGMAQSTQFLDMFKRMLPKEDIDNVYLKMSYNTGTLAFSPLSENIMDITVGRTNNESSGNTILVPQNDVLQEYIQRRLLKYYDKVESLPVTIVQTLLNTHMVEGLVWPQFYKESTGSMGEFINGLGSSGKDFASDGILSKKIASNGFIYGIDHVIKSRFFETVYSEIFLNPAHTLLDRAYRTYFQLGLREELMRSLLNGYMSERWTLLSFSDDLLFADGFYWDNVFSRFASTECPSGQVDGRLQRLMRMHIFPGIDNKEVSMDIKSFENLPLITASGGYDNWRYICNLYGDVVRYKDGQLQAAGNIEDKTYVNITPLKEDFNNGQIYTVDKLLEYSPRYSTANDARFRDLTMWQYIRRTGVDNPNVSIFIGYIERCLKSPDSDDLAGVKPENFYTVLMPTNAAMNQAISSGLIKALDKIDTDNPDITRENLAQATNFVNAHFLQQVIPDDGLRYIYPININSPDTALVSTLLKITDESLELTNARTLIKISKAVSGTTPTLVNFKPMNIEVNGKTVVEGGTYQTSGTTVRITRGPVTGTDKYRSNRIACKGIIHEINGYFKFTALKKE